MFAVVPVKLLFEGTGCRCACVGLVQAREGEPSVLALALARVFQRGRPAAMRIRSVGQDGFKQKVKAWWLLWWWECTH